MPQVDLATYAPIAISLTVFYPACLVIAYLSFLSYTSNTFFLWLENSFSVFQSDALQFIFKQTLSETSTYRPKISCVNSVKPTVQIKTS